MNCMKTMGLQPLRSSSKFACKALLDQQKFVSLSTRFPKPGPISLLLGQYRCWIAENIIATVTDSAQCVMSDCPKKNIEIWQFAF